MSTHPVSVSDGIRESKFGSAVRVESDAELPRLITAGPRMSAGERMEIYRASFAARLVECLADDYPALAYAVGEEAFSALARAYVVAHPPREKTLNYYGQKFAEFCLAAPHLESDAPQPSPSFLADLARLEWALVEALHAAGAPPLNAEDLARMTPEQWPMARFLLNPTLRLLALDHPVNAFFQAFRAEQAPAIPAASPLWVAVYRKDHRLWRVELDPARFALLSALGEGTPLGEALEHAAEHSAVAEGEVMAWFGQWIADGFFTGLH